VKRLRDAMLLLLLVAVGLRAAAELVAPLVPALIVLSVVISLLWVVLGRPRGL